MNWKTIFTFFWLSECIHKKLSEWRCKLYKKKQRIIKVCNKTRSPIASSVNPKNSIILHSPTQNRFVTQSCVHRENKATQCPSSDNNQKPSYTMRWLNIFRCLIITLLNLILSVISSLPLNTPGNQNENHAHQLNIIIKLNQGGQFAIFNIVNLETNTKELFY